MNLGKILLSASMIAFVGAAAFTGTGAFFSDTETSTGNTFTAGEIDLTVDSVAHYNGLVCFENEWVPEDAVEWDAEDEKLVGTDVNEGIIDFNDQNPNHFPQAGTECNGTWALTDLGPTHTFFNYGDLKPGDDGENTLSLHLDTNDGYVCAVISNLVDNDNGLTEPEEEDGDNTGGDGEGELSSELRFFAWADDGDNIWEDGEQVLFSNTEGPASDVIDGVSYDLFTPANGQVMPAGETAYIGLYWCYGDITVNEDANTLSCDGASVANVTQTDSMTADISFYVEQARNNENFTCPDPDEFGGEEGRTLEVAEQDLFIEDDKTAAYLAGDWFFYNDTNDTIMSIDQFAGNGGQNHMEEVDGSESAKMVLHDDVNARYNIATYQFHDVALADIDSLTYRMYDGSASPETPYLHLNIDFDNSDTWQGRLVQVPTGISANTWTTVDALSGMWTKTSGNWPAGSVSNGSIPGSTARSWADIIADYPSAETRSTDSFFGVRVGHPGPIGEVGAVDWIEFDGVTYDFVN